MTYQLPILECSSCGNYVGHLMEDYYNMSRALIDSLRAARVRPADGNVAPALDDVYKTKTGKDIKPYLEAYYKWEATIPAGSKKIRLSPPNVVARALLDDKEPPAEGDEKFYLIGGPLEADGQRNLMEPRGCCLRMFMGDPMMNEHVRS